MYIVDADYRFIAVDVRGYGQQSDGGTFGQWKLGQYIVDGTIALHEYDCLPKSNETAPYVFVADDALPFDNYIMKPFGAIIWAGNSKFMIIDIAEVDWSWKADFTFWLNFGRFFTELSITDQKGWRKPR